MFEFLGWFSFGFIIIIIISFCLVCEVYDGKRKEIFVNPFSCWLDCALKCVLYWVFRTKLKQTEVDCEFLKKCCEKLTDENLRLKKELQELRAQKIGAKPLYIQVSKATTLNICSSCEKELKPNEGKKGGISDVVRKSVGVKGI